MAPITKLYLLSVKRSEHCAMVFLLLSDIKPAFAKLLKLQRTNEGCICNHSVSNSDQRWQNKNVWIKTDTFLSYYIRINSYYSRIVNFDKYKYWIVELEWAKMSTKLMYLLFDLRNMTFSQQNISLIKLKFFNLALINHVLFTTTELL